MNKYKSMEITHVQYTYVLILVLSSTSCLSLKTSPVNWQEDLHLMIQFKENSPCIHYVSILYLLKKLFKINMQLYLIKIKFFLMQVY